MIIHLPVRTGSIGAMDPWGFGSRASVWDYPTLGLQGIVTTSTTGGVLYPRIGGVRPRFSDRGDYAPDQYWGQYQPTWTLPEGRVIHAVLREGQRVFIEG